MTRVSYSQRFEASLLLMCAHEAQGSTTSFGLLLTWSLWPQRTIFATGANYENLGNDKHLTVVKRTCNENGGPNILLLACFHTTPGGPSWTPQPHAAPIGTVLPEAKRARAISVSIRRRNNGSSVTRVTKPSAPAKAPSSIGCAPRQRPW